MSKLKHSDIENAAIKLANSLSTTDYAEFIRGFIHGANWAICIQEQREVMVNTSEDSDLIKDQNKILDL